MILLPTLIASTLLLAPQERVVRLDGTSTSGSLTAATLEEVRWTDAGGEEQSAPAGEVLRVTPGGANELLRQGERLLAELDFANAAASFEAAAGQGGPFWMEPWGQLRQAEAMLAWSSAEQGRAAEAAALFAAWTAANADSYWLPRARLGQATALSRSGKSDEAQSLMQGLSDLAFEKNLARHVELQAALVRSEAFLAGNQPEVAEARLRDLVNKANELNTAGDTPHGVRSAAQSVESRARILLGDAIEQKDGAAAAGSYWQGLADDPRSAADVRAAAWIGLAAAARADGRLREAQALLGRVVATVPAGPEVMGRALYSLGELSQETGDKPVSGRQYYQMLVDRYPTSSWAAKARTQLGG